MLVSSPSYAQEKLTMVGEPERVFGMLIRGSEHLDANGKMASGMTVDSDLSGLSFRSKLGIIKTMEESGYYALFLSADEEEITIYKAGFEPLKIDLAENNIDFEPGEMKWGLTVTRDERVMFPVQIIADRCNYQLRVDDDSMMVEGTKQVLSLESGWHEIVVKKKGYKEEKQRFRVMEEGDRTFTYSLQDSVYHQKRMNKVFQEEVSRNPDFPDDYESPLITVKSPANVYQELVQISDSKVVIRGILEDQNNITSLRINGMDVQVDAENTFEQEISLCTGTNRILMYAEDEAGNFGMDSFEIIRVNP